MEWSIFTHLYYSQKAKAYLLYSSLTNMIIELDKNGYDEITKIKKNPDCISPDDKDYKFLFDGLYIVKSNESEVNKIVLHTLQQRFDSKGLSLTLAPTRSCNFACPYCYEDDRANLRMTKKTQNGVLDFVKKFNQLNSLFVTWYGGEPTLAINTIKYLSSEFQKLGLNYNASMITNGYHIDKIADLIPELKINQIQITIDGGKESHNKTRILKNGRGTYDKILSNIDLLLLKNQSLAINIRMNISMDNSDQYPILHKTLKKRYGNRLHLYPAFVHNYVGNCQASSCFDDGHQKAQYIKNLFEEKKIYTNEMYPLRTFKGCMSQKLNAFVVGPMGELYKCWHHLGVKEKEVGNIFSQKAITNQDLLSDSMIKNDVIFDTKCKECVLFPSCYGGCIEQRNKNKEFCIPAKSMLEEFIDIRYHLRTQPNNACCKSVQK